MAVPTPKIVAYTGSEEGLVLEAYRDSNDIWTWALGVTAAAGVNVLNYKDRPSSIEDAVRASVKLIGDIYLPRVAKAFAGHALTEAQLAAALSFHWNTGAIGKTDWVRLWCAGRCGEARHFLENHYTNDGELKDRREREAALFFDGKWPNSLLVPVWGVAKPSYRPHGSKPVDLMPTLQKVLGVS
jgi:GH24 family phage-related lysozyme (muramidase)